MPALFSRFVYAVRSDEAMGVVKHKRRHLERDSTMFSLVVHIFDLVPFESHSVYTECSTMWRWTASITA